MQLGLSSKDECSKTKPKLNTITRFPILKYKGALTIMSVFQGHHDQILYFSQTQGERQHSKFNTGTKIFFKFRYSYLQSLVSCF